MDGLGNGWVYTVMCGFRLCWLGSVLTEVGGFGWARLWVPMDGSTVGGYGSVVLVVKAFVVGSNVSVDDGDDEVGVWVDSDDDDNDEDGDLESGLTWIMKVLGLEVGAGESVEAVGLWLRWWWWWGFQFGVSGLWVCFELCFGLWMKMVVV